MITHCHCGEPLFVKNLSLCEKHLAEHIYKTFTEPKIITENETGLCLFALRKLDVKIADHLTKNQIEEISRSGFRLGFGDIIPNSLYCRSLGCRERAIENDRCLKHHLSYVKFRIIYILHVREDKLDNLVESCQKNLLGIKKQNLLTHNEFKEVTARLGEKHANFLKLLKNFSPPAPKKKVKFSKIISYKSY